MGRRRDKGNSDLPPYLYVRGGYYSFRHPHTKKEYGLGRNRALAISEAIQANIELLGSGKPLSVRISEALTLSSWCEEYMKIAKQRGLKQKTIHIKKGLHKIICSNIGEMPLTAITTKNIADILNEYVNKQKSATAKMIRAELNDIFKEAIAAGYLTLNPVTNTRTPKCKVHRSRLSIGDYMKILAKADEITPTWFSAMLRVALITGQRQGDLCTVSWEDVTKTHIRFTQEKTGAKIAIPLSLTMVGMQLADALPPHGKGSIFVSSTKSAPSPRTVRYQFQRARDAANIEWGDKTPPSFHEIRSLSARLYAKERGADFAKRLLGHKSMSTTDKYRELRGEWDEIDLE
ncbi:tyrosine-type recombinase/integrase [Edwardsiella tarda]